MKEQLRLLLEYLNHPVTEEVRVTLTGIHLPISARLVTLAGRGIDVTQINYEPQHHNSLYAFALLSSVIGDYDSVSNHLTMAIAAALDLFYQVEVPDYILLFNRDRYTFIVHAKDVRYRFDTKHHTVHHSKGDIWIEQPTKLMYHYVFEKLRGSITLISDDKKQWYIY